MYSLDWSNLPWPLVPCLAQPLSSISRVMLMRRIPISCSIIVVLIAFSFAGCGGYSSTGPVNGGGPGGSYSGVDVLTYHYDNQRTGQNLDETALTPVNVNSTKFGKLGEFPVDGRVDAQPLYLSQVTIGGQKKNVLYVATEHGSVYAFDADSISGTTSTLLWKTTTLGSGESTSDDRGCGQVSPEIGITSTPVIDLAAGSHGTMYLVAMSKNGSNYFQRLHALDITTGAEEGASPVTIQATFPNIGGHTTFDPKQYKERAGLLLLNGVIYTR